ncbi:MAG: hypothetical protein COV34_02910 [Candidatus Zambryskibacteria bacterium CG10_big_fil_rev_8_21_14_0_10_42_12]|uniref:Cytochrome C biogenesis protein transmembrane domain-containing protein n=1 Tax=Candidatus Zambryskibacteria bacterium CG10_big_fil_rev_8_21_14_0_10_42_12 TaxID=1975115 RepID=A0A2H0QUR3_9BACT|nr:MAG: hypothetical protein COV34_02910 [Candidatus Zambryskibacteria bacterium CG10_big_fil_rev_8_21_14_0_10_42_12]
MKKILLLTPLAVVPNVASAHCPLCTAGAGALAVLAASLGVSSVIVGILIGAFALALGLWISRTIQTQYVPYQISILTTVIFLGTVVPIMPLIQHYAPLYIPFIGEYGTTYTINLYLLGVLIGAIIMLISPYLSRFITKTRGKQIPYQGISLTLSLLILVSILIQVLS